MTSPVPEPIAVTPIYASGDVARILEIEQRQIEEAVADLTEAQMKWRPNSTAKSALDILRHLAYPDLERPEPSDKAEALQALRAAHAKIQRDIAIPGRLDAPVPWWTGETIPFRGKVWGAIRHRTDHLGELVYLRLALGLDEPRYYHEEQEHLPGNDAPRTQASGSPGSAADGVSVGLT